MILLIDERRKKLQIWQEVLMRSYAYFDEPADRHVKVSNICLQSKTFGKCGHDVVILDSITISKGQYRFSIIGKVLLEEEANALPNQNNSLEQLEILKVVDH